MRNIAVIILVKMQPSLKFTLSKIPYLLHQDIHTLNTAIQTKQDYISFKTKYFFLKSLNCRFLLAPSKLTFSVSITTLFLSK